MLYGRFRAAKADHSTIELFHKKYIYICIYIYIYIYASRLRSGCLFYYSQNGVIARRHTRVKLILLIRRTIVVNQNIFVLRFFVLVNQNIFIIRFLLFFFLFEEYRGLVRIYIDFVSNIYLKSA
jgi:hypothetical protein